MSATISSKRTRSAKSSSTALEANIVDEQVTERTQPKRQRKAKLSNSLLLDDGAEREATTSTTSSSTSSRAQRTVKQAASSSKKSMYAEQSDSEGSDDDSADEYATSGKTDVATSSKQKATSSSSSKPKVVKERKKLTEARKALEQAGDVIVNQVRMQLQSLTGVSAVQITAAQAAVQKLVDDLLAEATTKKDANFYMMSPYRIQEAVKTAVADKADKVEWQVIFSYMCKQFQLKGRRYVKQLTAKKPFKRPTANQLKKIDTVELVTSDENSYRHLQPLIEMLAPDDLCRLRSVNQHWRRVVNSFDSWPAALTIPASTVVHGDAPRRRQLQLFMQAPAASLSKVRTVVLSVNSYFFGRGELSQLLWAMRQSAPHVERIAILDLSRKLNVEMTPLLSFPQLHSFSLHDSRVHSWTTRPEPWHPYKEREGRTDGEIQYNPFIPQSQWGTYEEDYADYMADESRPVNKQWVQLKEKCSGWFKHTEGGGEAGLKAAVTFSDYVHPPEIDEASMALPPPLEFDPAPGFDDEMDEDEYYE